MTQPTGHTSSTVDVTGSVVVAVDGSSHASRALRWAGEQAFLEHCPLVIISVGEAVDRSAGHAAVTARELHPDLAVRSAAVPGDPREVLIALSAQARLLVMGSRGRGSLRGMMLGSVSAAVAAQAACPVVICRPSKDQFSQSGIIVGADATPESLPVIEFAYHQAALRGVPLTVLHCFWDAAVAVAQYREARGERPVPPDLESLRATLSASVAGFSDRYPDVPVDLTLKHGFVEEALTPRHGGWDLVVVGRHPMTSLGRVLIGSIATTIVERAHGPVAVIPEDPASL